MPKSQRLAFLLFLPLITFTGYLYVAVPSCNQFAGGCYGLHTTILSHTAPAPYAYRYLAPFLVGALSQANLFIGYAALHLICFALLYPALYTWLSRYLSIERTFAALLIMALGFWLGFHFWYFSPWSTLEITLVCLALAWMDKPFALYAGLTLLASLNRETGILLAFIYIAYHFESKSLWRYMTLLLIYGLAQIGLTAIVGIVPQYMSLENNLRGNLILLPETLLANLPLLPIAFLIAVNFKRSKPVFKRLALIACGYSGAVLFGAVWLEFPRLVLSVLPLVLPVIVEGENGM